MTPSSEISRFSFGICLFLRSNFNLNLFLEVLKIMLCFRPLVQLPFTFGSGKPPQSSLLSAGSSSQMHTGQKFGTSSFICRMPKFEKHLEMIPEDGTPEILQGNCTPAGVVKSTSTSPNSKRISSPHHKIGSTRAWRSGRKLILRSIPSFPSLNPCQESGKRSPGKTQ